MYHLYSKTCPYNIRINFVLPFTCHSDRGVDSSASHFGGRGFQSGLKPLTWLWFVVLSVSTLRRKLDEKLKLFRKLPQPIKFHLHQLIYYSSNWESYWINQKQKMIFYIARALRNEWCKYLPHLTNLGYLWQVVFDLCTKQMRNCKR
jgi:hypothetical protein